MNISIHERLLFWKMKDKEHGKLEMFSVLFILNTIRYCTLFTVIETIICSDGRIINSTALQSQMQHLQPQDTRDTVNKVNENGVIMRSQSKKNTAMH